MAAGDSAMKEFILFMHDDAGRPGAPAEWTTYFDRLHQSGRSQGGSAIGDGQCHRKTGLPGPVHSSLGGYIRLLAEDLEDAKTFIVGNPVFEAGGTVEIRELPRTD